MNVSPFDILKQYFRHDSFRPLQEDIINTVLQKKDVLGIVANWWGEICLLSGARISHGWSLPCYQPPHRADEGSGGSSFAKRISQPSQSIRA